MNFQELHSRLVAKEQIFAEKLKSLLRIGPVSTRFKDVYDMYYLHTRVRKTALRNLLQRYIFGDPKLCETDMAGIYSRLTRIFKDKRFFKGLKDPTFAWLDVPAEEATAKILDFINSL